MVVPGTSSQLVVSAISSRQDLDNLSNLVRTVLAPHNHVKTGAAPKRRAVNHTINALANQHG